MSNILTQLEHQFKQQKSSQSDNFNLRVHRAISWLKDAEKMESLDHQFISLWIAFNATYAREFDDRQSRDRSALNEFLGRVCAFDEHHQIYDLIWKKFSGSIRLLLDNQYIFQPFWDFHNGDIAEIEWQKEFALDRDRAFDALETKNTHRILTVLFSRLYTLRNQIVHGGATCESKVNRSQLKDGCQILSFLLPAMLQIMLDNHDQIEWGKPFYPVV